MAQMKAACLKTHFTVEKLLDFRGSEWFKCTEQQVAMISSRGKKKVQAMAIWWGFFRALEIIDLKRRNAMVFL